MSERPSTPDTIIFRAPYTPAGPVSPSTSSDPPAEDNEETLESTEPNDTELLEDVDPIAEGDDYPPLPPPESFPSSSIAAVASRRRMAFVLREKAAAATPRPEPAIPTPAPPLDPTLVAPTPIKAKQPWTNQDVMVFFEGIKLYGKDFESVAKFMARRKLDKPVEQVKAFFNNSIKSYRVMLELTDDDFGHLPRDARELFLMINACEWKRKTCNLKMQVDKFKELVFKGTVTFRAGRRLFTIRTPPCPALVRYFTIKRADKVPPAVYVHLEPTSNGDHVFLRNRDQNPFLRVKLSTNDRIMKLLDFLHRKWASAGDFSPVSVTLWPDSSCEIANLVVSTSENSPYIALSVNKLMKNMEEAKEKIQPVKKSSTDGVAPIKSGLDFNTKVKPSHTIIYQKPFTLTDQVIANGLTFRNVRSASVAELFFVCGRKNPIKLRYQVRCENPESRSIEPWRSLISLLDQGYAEVFTPQFVTKQPETVSRPTPPPKRPRSETPVEQGPAGNPVSEIVRQETDDFESQLALLRNTSRLKTSNPTSRKRKSKMPKLASRTPQLNIRPETVDAPEEVTKKSLSRQISTAPKCTIVRKKPGTDGFTHFFKQPAAKKNPSEPKPPCQPSTSQQRSLPIDFSSIFRSPVKDIDGRSAKDLELMKKRTEDFLSSLKTPADTPQQTPKKTQFQQYFGDELSMSPSSTRHATLLDADEDDDEKNDTMMDFTDMMFEQIPDTDTVQSSQNLDFSVSEVHEHLHEMMTSSQNSHDFVVGIFDKKKKLVAKKKQ